MSKRRILLSGASGFSGSHILRHLLENTDWEFVLPLTYKHMGKGSRLIQQLQGRTEWWDRVKIFKHDLRLPIDDQMALHFGSIDYILNVASESHVDRSITAPREFIENNVQLILSILEYARRYPVEKIIQISTDEVYGVAPQGHNHKEGEPHKPSNPYSASKAAQEDICYSYWRTYGLPIIITNTMNLIGEMQDPEKFVPKTIRAVQNGDVMTIHASKEGHIGSRFYLHTRNQADALMFILKNITPIPYSEGKEITRYNVVGEREIDNLEMARMIAKFAGKELKYELVDFHGSRPGHDLRYALDGTKLAKEGWKAPLSLEESLKNTIEWQQQHPEWL